MRYKIQRRTEAAPSWGLAIEHCDNLGDAVKIASSRNKMHDGGTAVHRVVDTETGEEKYSRGWLESEIKQQPT